MYLSYVQKLQHCSSVLLQIWTQGWLYFSVFPPSTSCAFVSNLNESAVTPKLQPGQEVMQSVLEKDLVMNVYRDGHWGAFRHQLVTAGNIFFYYYPIAYVFSVFYCILLLYVLYNMCTIMFYYLFVVGTVWVSQKVSELCMEKFLNHAVVQVHPCINALCDNTKGIEASLIPQIIV